MKRIRILLAGMPPLLLDMLQHVIASEPDMTVVGQIGHHDLRAAARRGRVDVIVVGQNSEADCEDYLQLLLQQPRIKVLAVADQGKTGSLYELRPHRTPLGEMSAAALCSAIRGRKNSAAKPTKPNFMES